MGRTALACAALLCATYASASWLTHGFQAWTAEDARRLEVALAPVDVPPAAIDGPSMDAGNLRDVVADGRHVTIVEFFYAHCESVCLAAGSTFQQLQESLRTDPARVQLLSISFDPRRDTPEVLQAYGKRLHADPAHWRFVRVPDPAQAAALLRAFQVVVVPDGRGDFEHNAALLVVDAQGRLVRIFDLDQQQLALDYARHVAEGGRS